MSERDFTINRFFEQRFISENRPSFKVQGRLRCSRPSFKVQGRLRCSRPSFKVQGRLPVQPPLVQGSRASAGAAAPRSRFKGVCRCSRPSFKVQGRLRCSRPSFKVQGRLRCSRPSFKVQSWGEPLHALNSRACAVMIPPAPACSSASARKTLFSPVARRVQGWETRWVSLIQR